MVISVAFKLVKKQQVGQVLSFKFLSGKSTICTSDLAPTKASKTRGVWVLGARYPHMASCLPLLLKIHLFVLLSIGSRYILHNWMIRVLSKYRLWLWRKFCNSNILKDKKIKQCIFFFWSIFCIANIQNAHSIDFHQNTLKSQRNSRKSPKSQKRLTNSQKNKKSHGQSSQSIQVIVRLFDGGLVTSGWPLHPGRSV